MISAMLDPNIMNKTGRILVTAELGQEYGFKDVGGWSLLFIMFFSFCNKCIPRDYKGDREGIPHIHPVP